VVFHRHLAAFVVLAQREKPLPFRELLGKISEQLRGYFAMPPLRLANSRKRDELAFIVFRTAGDG